MGTTPVCTIDAFGIHRPSLGACLAYFAGVYSGIYGSDIDIDGDTQDGQALGVLSTALDDVNSSTVNSYNSFSPTYAQGVGLSSLVKLNGLEREVPSFSTVAVNIIGQAFTEIAAGIVFDGANSWTLPVDVEIPIGGEVPVTLTCQTLGAIVLPQGQGAGFQFTIQTQILGWQFCTATASAEPGLPVELDPQLRIRQSNSTATPSQTVLAGLVGQLLEVPGVVAVQPYENDTSLPDVNEQPGNTIALVVNGGNAKAIVNTIGINKGPGVNTFGTLQGTYVDAYGIGHLINYFTPNFRPVFFSLQIRALTGYTTDVATMIAQALAAWVGSAQNAQVGALGIGQNLLLNRANVPANLAGPWALAAAQLANPSAAQSTLLANLAAAALTYEIVSLQVAVGNGTAALVDLTAAFTDQFTNDATTTTVTVVL